MIPEELVTYGNAHNQRRLHLVGLVSCGRNFIIEYSKKSIHSFGTHWDTHVEIHIPQLSVVARDRQRVGRTGQNMYAMSIIHEKSTSSSSGCQAMANHP